MTAPIRINDGAIALISLADAPILTHLAKERKIESVTGFLKTMINPETKMIVRSNVYVIALFLDPVIDLANR